MQDNVSTQSGAAASGAGGAAVDDDDTKGWKTTTCVGHFVTSPRVISRALSAF